MTWYHQKGNKYGAKSTIYDGKVYDSKKEAAYAAELDLRLRAADILRWERQVRLDLKIDGRHICNYYIDFVITHNDGSKEYIEIKGFKTEVWRLKWKMTEVLLEKMDPGSKLTLIT